MNAIGTLDLGEERAAVSDRWRAGTIAAVLTACCTAVVPIIQRPLGTSYPLFAIVIALSIAAITLTSLLLWAQAKVTRSIPLSVLALGYALTAAMMVPYLLFYRGLGAQLALWFSAGSQASAWLYVEWHLAFLCSTILYFGARKYHLERKPLEPAAFRTLRRRLALSGVAIIAVTVPPAIWVAGLPVLAVNGVFTANFIALFSLIAGVAVVAIGVAYRMNRFGTLLDLWLGVACFSMLADVVMTAASRQFTPGWYVSRFSILLAASSLLIVLLLQTASIYEELAVTAERLRGESLTDVLTGLANRRRFNLHFDEVMREASRATRPVALIMLDIDNFKQYNDTFGHLAGDECLRTIASILLANVGRARDLVARTGGEEIAIIMPEVDARGALAVAERVRASVEAARVPQGRDAVHPIVTISVGVACTRDPASSSIPQLVLAADRALYRAKAAGRNCVVEAADVLLGLPNA